jgi:Na+/H+-dicarboxylate symporter
MSISPEKTFLQKFLMPISIVVSIILGALMGVYFGSAAEFLGVFTKIFMWFIKNLTPYLIFLAISSGILSIGSLEQLKRLGLKAGGIYMLTAFFAVIIGISAGILFQPGIGFSVPAAKPIPDTAFIDTLLSSPLLSLVVMTLLLSVATLAIKDYYESAYLKAKDTTPKNQIEQDEIEKILVENPRMIKKIDLLIFVIIAASKVLFKGIGWIIWLAPLAVLGAMATLFSSPEGFSALASYAKLVEAFMMSIGFQFVVLAAALLFLGKLNPVPFFKKVWPVQMMAFSTSSSKATLPFAMNELRQKLGASEKGANFILPLGATINMDGTAIYLGLCAVFFAQAYGIDLSMSQYLIIAFTCTMGSIGAAGLPAGSLIFMPMTLAAAGIPAEGIPVIIAIDRILDMVRTMTNITGDCALALVVDSQEGGIDKDVYNA